MKHGGGSEHVTIDCVLKDLLLLRNLGLLLSGQVELETKAA